MLEKILMKMSENIKIKKQSNFKNKGQGQGKKKYEKGPYREKDAKKV